MSEAIPGPAVNANCFAGVANSAKAFVGKPARNTRRFVISETTVRDAACPADTRYTQNVLSLIRQETVREVELPCYCEQTRLHRLSIRRVGTSGDCLPKSSRWLPRRRLVCKQ